MTKSKAPVLLGAPPAPTDASHSHGRCLFYNGTEDRLGAPRLALPSSNTESQSPKATPEPASSTVAIPDAEPTGAISTSHGDQPEMRPRKNRTVHFRPVDVLISTSPIKHPAKTPSEVLVVDGSESDDGFMPFTGGKPTRDARGTKRKASSGSIALASSEGERSDVSRVPEKADKGKRRASDVGMRTPSPPRPDAKPQSANTGLATVCILASLHYLLPCSLTLCCARRPLARHLLLRVSRPPRTRRLRLLLPSTCRLPLSRGSGPVMTHLSQHQPKLLRLDR